MGERWWMAPVAALMALLHDIQTVSA